MKIVVAIIAFVVWSFCGIDLAQSQSLCGGIPGANQFCASPSGGAGPMAPRAITGADLPGQYRAQLTGNQTYYVNGNTGGTAICGTTGALTCAAGSESNNCLSNTAPCATVNHVFAVIGGKVDLAQNSIVINLAHGTHAPFGCFGALIGNAALMVQGDTNAPTAAIIQASGGLDAVFVKDYCGIQLDSVNITTSGGARAIHAAQNGIIDPSNVTVADFPGQGFFVAEGSGANINIGSGNVISGNTGAALSAQLDGVIKIVSPISIPVAKAFSWTALTSGGGSINSTLGSGTFTGAGVADTTGVRALVASNSSLALNGTACATVFPGNQACQFASGGQDDAGEAIVPISQGGTNASTLADAQTNLRIGTFLGGVLKGANFNTTADQAITITSPSNYMIDTVWVVNCSTSLTTAQGAVYAGAGKANLAIGATTTPYSGCTSSSINAAGSGTRPLAAGSAWLNVGTIYLSLTTPQGGAATADVYVYIRPMP